MNVFVTAKGWSEGGGNSRGGVEEERDRMYTSE